MAKQNAVPEGWAYSSIGESAANVSKKYVPEQGINPRYIGLEHIKPDTNLLQNWGYADEVISAKTAFVSRDTLFGKLRPYLKKVSFADFDGICSTDILAIRASNDNHPEFIYRVLSSEGAILHSMESSAGNVMPRTSWKDMADFQYLRPPLPEQQKIAAILSSVDDVIEKTQAQIDKLKDLKTGMMQELLTRGVCDENGKRHTEFKDSPVGRIPVGWDIVKFGDIFEDRNEMTGDEVKYVLSSLTIEFGLVKKPERYVRDFLITDKNKDSYKVVHPNDFLFNPMNLRWGAIARSGHKYAVIVSKYYNVLKPRIRGDLRFYEYLLKSDLYLQRYEVIATGTLVEKKRVHWSALKNMTIPLPPVCELMEISERVGAAETLLEGKQQKLSQYKDLKKALMQDLLTGKVRVNVDN